MSPTIRTGIALTGCALALIGSDTALATPPDPAVTSPTYLAFDSSPTSWVGRGHTDYLVSPDTGWTITAQRNNDDGVNFAITRDTGAPPFDDYFWNLNLAAPFGATLTPGQYTGAMRYPFQEAANPGIDFFGNHRGNNKQAGQFEVLEAVYAPNGDVLRFALDFTQYGEEDLDRWIIGELRFVAVPEPATATIMAGAIIFAAAPSPTHRRRPAPRSRTARV